MAVSADLSAIPDSQCSDEIEQLLAAMDTADKAGRYPKLTVERPWSRHNPVLEGAPGTSGSRRARMALSIDRLKHYTGTDAEMFQRLMIYVASAPRPCSPSRAGNSLAHRRSRPSAFSASRCVRPFCGVATPPATGRSWPRLLPGFLAEYMPS
jgi:hypothetical protein